LRVRRPSAKAACPSDLVGSGPRGGRWAYCQGLVRAVPGPEPTLIGRAYVLTTPSVRSNHRVIRPQEVCMTTPSTRPDEAVEASGIWVAETKLRAGSLRLSGALMQNITHIAPAIAAFFFTPFVVSLAGAHSVLAYAVGVVVVFGLGVCLTQL